MNKETRQRKHTGTIFKALRGQEWLAGHVAQILETGKERLDRILQELGGMVAETIMLLEREELAGPDYCPTTPGVTKGAGSRTKGLTMAFKLLEMAERRLRCLNGGYLLPLLWGQVCRLSMDGKCIRKRNRIGRRTPNHDLDPQHLTISQLCLNYPSNPSCHL